MSFKVKDFIFTNRWQEFPDGYIVKFENTEAIVPDQYVDYFQRRSDFQVQQHIEDQPVAQQPVVVSTPVEAAQSEEPEDEVTEEAEPEVQPVEETPTVVEPETESTEEQTTEPTESEEAKSTDVDEATKEE